MTQSCLTWLSLSHRLSLQMLYTDVWPMHELRAISAWVKTKMTNRVLAEEAGEGRDENGIILMLPFLTFTTLKGHSEHPASSSPVVLWRAPQSGGTQVPSLQSLSRKTYSIWPLRLMRIIHDRRSSSVRLSASEGDTGAEESASEWMTERRKETERDWGVGGRTRRQYI